MSVITEKPKRKRNRFVFWTIFLAVGIAAGYFCYEYVWSSKDASTPVGRARRNLREYDAKLLAASDRYKTLEEILENFYADEKATYKELEELFPKLTESELDSEARGDGELGDDERYEVKLFRLKANDALETRRDITLLEKARDDLNYIQVIVGNIWLHIIINHENFLLIY